MAKKKQPKQEQPKQSGIVISAPAVMAALDNKEPDALKLYEQYAKIVKDSGAKVSSGLKQMASEIRNQ